MIEIQAKETKQKREKQSKISKSTITKVKEARNGVGRWGPTILFIRITDERTLFVVPP